MTSLILMVLFILFADYIFNENSNLCLLPKSLKKIKKQIDIDKDGIISEKELNDAIYVLTKAKNKKKDNARSGLYD